MTVEAPTLAALKHLVENEEFGCRVVVMSAGHVAGSAVLDGDGGFITGSVPDELTGPIVSDAVKLMDVERTTTLGYESGVEVFFDVLAPPPRLLVFGAVHVAQTLVPIARLLGFGVTVSDARPAFITTERFPEADHLLVGWPGDLEEQLQFDRRTFVVILSHDARYEDPLWPLVLPSNVRYIGAMGSRKTAAARNERLAALGYDDAVIARINGPVGIDIGAVEPGEIAVSIMAEITAKRYGSDTRLDLTGLPVRLTKTEHL